MKPLLRRLARGRHAVYGTLAEGVLTTIAGLMFQAQPAHNLQISPTTLLAIGIASIVLATATLIATYLVDPVLVGEIVEIKQPQLPDVQVHTHRTPELSQAA